MIVIIIIRNHCAVRCTVLRRVIAVVRGVRRRPRWEANRSSRWRRAAYRCRNRVRRVRLSRSIIVRLNAPRAHESCWSYPFRFSIRFFIGFYLSSLSSSSLSLSSSAFILSFRPSPKPHNPHAPTTLCALSRVYGSSLFSTVCRPVFTRPENHTPNAIASAGPNGCTRRRFDGRTAAVSTSSPAFGSNFAFATTGKI